MKPLLQLENATKSFGDRTLFENISFSIAEGQKVALVAKNGAGKTTLISIILGEDSLTGGAVVTTNNIRIAHLSQVEKFDLTKTIGESLFNNRGELYKDIENYYILLEKGEFDKAMEIYDKIEACDGWSIEQRAKELLSVFNLEDLEKPVSILSGGQLKRLSLALTLIEEADLYILDEPTNHLDLDLVEWLEEYLRKMTKAVLLVTHDRYFLDRVCNKIIELEDEKVYQYDGNFSYFLEKKALRVQMESTTQDRLSNLYKNELEWIRKQPRARGTKAKYRVEAFEDLKGQLNRRLEQKLDLNIKSSRLGTNVLEINNLCKSFGEQVLIKNFTYKYNRFEKIGIIGRNGTGKTTLLNILTGSVKQDSGTAKFGETIKVGYYRQDGLKFNEDSTMLEEVQKIAEYIELGGGRKLSASQLLQLFLFPVTRQRTLVRKLSNGERKRLYLAIVLMASPNFLILDEPTNDLDIATLTVLEDYLASFDGCVLIVSHDRFFMDKVVDHLFVALGDGVITDFPGNYSQYRERFDLFAPLEESDKEVKAEIKPDNKKANESKEGKDNKNRLTYNEKRELETLTKEIEELENEKMRVETILSNMSYKEDEIGDLTLGLKKVLDSLENKELRWLELSEKES